MTFSDESPYETFFFMSFGPPQSAWSLFSQIFGVRPAETAVARLRVAERAVLAFVPRALALAPRPAAGGQPEPRVATALVAIAEARNASAPRHAWLRSLPRQFAFSQVFSADCRAVIGAGFARGLLDDHERLLQELLSLRPPLLAESPVTREEALWGLGLVMHLGIGEGAALAPGLLDGVPRHWGEDRCAELVPDVAPDDRREPGWALVARQAIAPGEPVRLCSLGGAPNAELLATFGVAYPDNPFGPSLLQGPPSLAAELRDAALEADCDPAVVVQLRLHRDAGAVLPLRQPRVARRRCACCDGRGLFSHLAAPRGDLRRFLACGGGGILWPPPGRLLGGKAGIGGG